MDGKTKVIIAVVLSVSLLTLAIVMFIPFGDTEVAKDGHIDEPVDADPVVPAEDDPVSEPSSYPDGIRYDAGSRTLISDSYSEWAITDELAAHIDKTVERCSGSSVTLDPGFYKVTVDGGTFYVTVDGTESRTVSWAYRMGGADHQVRVTYDIDISELSDVMMSSRELNSDPFLKFDDLSALVYVDGTMRSIVSQLESEYARIGGSPEDRQAFADFIVSFAQLGIEYPSRPYVWTDDDGNPVTVEGVPKVSTDYEVWGREDYWANALETLHYGVGDCEDSAAVACSLLKAAGFRVAMVGLYGHVAASVELDGFTERELSDYRSVITTRDSLAEASGGSAMGGHDGITYYAVDTVNGQMPVGYLTAGPLQTLGDMSPWGLSGFYPA